MKRIKLIIITIVIGIAANSYPADINTEMQNMFNRLGFSATSTSYGAYEGQTRGFYTGGSVIARAPYDNIQVLTFNPPKISAGCSGIDFHMGAMSYINVDQLIQKLRAIGQNTLGYAFYLALSTVSPEIKNILQELESLTSMVNNLNISSCQAAKTLVNSVTNKLTEGSQEACFEAAMANSSSTDRVQARTNCKNNSQSIFNNLNSTQRRQYSPARNYEWEALKNIPLLDSNTDLKRQLLSVLGATIVRIENDSVNVDFIAPELTVSDLVNGRNNARLLNCNDADCMTISYTTTNITGFKKLVEDTMSSIFDKIRTRVALTQSEIDFVNSIPAPIYKMLNVYSAFPESVGRTFINKSSEPLAITIALHWIDMAYDYIYRGLNSVPDNTGIVTEVRKRIQSIRREAYILAQRADDIIRGLDALVEETMFYEKILAQNLPGDLLQNYRFAQWIR